jgi:hypothetical protein
MFFKKKGKHVAFLCYKNQIDDLIENDEEKEEGIFSLRGLKIFSNNNNAMIIIKDYGVIDNGELNLYDQRH